MLMITSLSLTAFSTFNVSLGMLNLDNPDILCCADFSLKTVLTVNFSEI